MFYTYVIRSKKSGMWYTGYTNDLRKRFIEHNSNKVFSTKGRGPFELIYFEGCINQRDARDREKYLKSGMGKRYLKNRLKRFLSLTGFAPLEIRTKGAAAASLSCQEQLPGQAGNLSLTGFTLIEVMVVVIIIGILAGIAMPLYSRVVERARIAEAVRMLGVIRVAEMSYATEYGNYSNGDGSTNLVFLNIGFNSTGKYFDIGSGGALWANPYTVADDTLCAAVRNNVNTGVFGNNYFIFMNESGKVWSTRPEVDEIVKSYWK